jgi:hypothetical protein
VISKPNRNRERSAADGGVRHAKSYREQTDAGINF